MSPSPKKKKREDPYEKILEKAETRKQSGCDPIIADWQFIMEITLNMAGNQLQKRPGWLFPLQISARKEWEFYLDLQEKLDLPPDTNAVFCTPSFSNRVIDIANMKPTDAGGKDAIMDTKEAYSVIISDCQTHDKIMHVSLPGKAVMPGIDVFEDGKHLAGYSYHRAEECTDALGKVPWIFFSPKGDWEKSQIIRYTENWFLKSFDVDHADGFPIHSEFSYVHHPGKISLTPLESIFQLLQATIPIEIDSIETAVEITNDLNLALESGEVLVTKSGILQADRKQCQVLADRIVIEIDQQLEKLEVLKMVKFPDRTTVDYKVAFESTARNIFELITGRRCPKSVTIE